MARTDECRLYCAPTALLLYLGGWWGLVVSDFERTIKLDLREVPKPSPKRPALVILQGHPLGLTIQLENQRTTMGRGTHTDVVLRDDIASRQHAEIVKLDVEGECSE